MMGPVFLLVRGGVVVRLPAGRAPRGLRLYDVLPLALGRDHAG